MRRRLRQWIATLLAALLLAFIILNFENWLTANKLDNLANGVSPTWMGPMMSGALNALAHALSYPANSFALGAASGALLIGFGEYLFALLPARWRPAPEADTSPESTLSAAQREEDFKLAEKCEKLASELRDAATVMKVEETERRMAGIKEIMTHKDVDMWERQQIENSKVEQKYETRYRQRINEIEFSIKRREAYIRKFAFSWNSDMVSNLSRTFEEIADSLRVGDYQGRIFQCTPFD